MLKKLFSKSSGTDTLLGMAVLLLILILTVIMAVEDSKG
jgi:hypothetical protein